MAKIFYYGSDDRVYGPVTELEVQGWYACGYFSSDVRFQISSRSNYDRDGRFYTLGELIDINGRTLPFYFSHEKQNREKDMEEKLSVLTQEVNSLRRICNDNIGKSAEKREVVDIQSQLASIKESHSSLLVQVKGLSKQKENSPIPPQLEKKVSELKQKGDEQEKNLVSMKKELSAVTSKCDRNETKMDKLMKIVEETVTVCEKHYCEFKESEKLLKERGQVYEQTADSTSNVLKSIASDLSAIKKEMEEHRKETATSRSEMDKVKKDLSGVMSAVETIEERIVEAIKNEELLRKDIETVKESARKVDVNPNGIASELRKLNDSEDMPPWESEEKKNGIHSCIEIEPWSEQRSTKDSIEAKKTESEQSIETKEKKTDEAAATSDTASTVVKAKPKAKDWDAICKELSDDDDEQHEKTVRVGQLTTTEVSAGKFILDSVAVLRAYCDSLQSSEFDLMSPGNFNILKMDSCISTLDPKSPQYSMIRDALKTEMRVLTSEILICGACDFNITTPRHLLYHFVDSAHAQGCPNVPQQFRAAFVEMANFIARLLYKFIASLPEIYEVKNVEDAFNERGRQLVMQRRDRSRHQPRPEFIDAMEAEKSKALERAINTEFPKEKMEQFNRRQLSIVVRKLFGKLENRTFPESMEKDLKEGIPFCECCIAAFDSPDEYFKHMTTYSHAMKDNTFFSLNMRLWVGHKYWDPML